MLKDIYLSNSQLPKRYQKEIMLQPAIIDEQTFKELNDIKLNIKQFVDEGSNLLICSNNCGCGKTAWSSKILKAYIDSVSDKSFRYQCPALFVNITNFLNEKKLAINDRDLEEKIKDTERKILSAKLVVFDDLGVKDLSEYDNGNLYYWVDTRVNNCLSSIYTSNLMPEQLKQILDSRIYSRVINYSYIKEIKDGDHRKVGD